MEVHFLILPPAKPRHPLDRYALKSEPPYVPTIEPEPVKRWPFWWTLLAASVVNVVFWWAAASAGAWVWKICGPVVMGWLS